MNFTPQEWHDLNKLYQHEGFSILLKVLKEVEIQGIENILASPDGLLENDKCRLDQLRGMRQCRAFLERTLKMQIDNAIKEISKTNPAQGGL